MIENRYLWNLATRAFGIVIALVILAQGRVAVGHGAPAKPAHGDGGHSAPPQAAPEPSADATKSGTNGVELGEFRIKVYHAPESQKSSTSFALYATVAKDRLSDSQHLIEHRVHKLRDQVIVVTRLMPLADFNDPELKTFRRRILLQLRRTLPELAIESVYISDFELAVERI